MRRARLTMVVILLVAAAVAVTALDLSIAPSLDVPLPPDSNLFGVGGGLSVEARWDVPFCRVLSAGARASHRLAPMGRADFADLGSLDVIAASATLQARLPLSRALELRASGLLGYYLAFEHGDASSWATNLVAGGGIGVGYRASPRVTVGIRAVYRSHVRLYHAVGVAAWLELQL